MRSSASRVGNGRLANVPKAKRMRKSIGDYRMIRVRKRYVLMAFVAVATVTSLLLLLPCSHSDSSKKTTVAAGGPLIVSGHVYDSLGNPIPDLNVNVTTKWPGGTPRMTMTDSTDSSGFYTVTFDRDWWDAGNILEANASYLGEKATNSTTLVIGLQTMDLHFTALIPEFSDIAVIVVATAALCGIFANRRRAGRGGLV